MPIDDDLHGAVANEAAREEDGSRKNCLNPTYNGVKSKEDTTELEQKIALLENHLYFSGIVAVEVERNRPRSKNKSTIVYLQCAEINLDAQGKDGKLRRLKVETYGDGRYQVTQVTIEQEKYHLIPRVKRN